MVKHYFSTCASYLYIILCLEMATVDLKKVFFVLFCILTVDGYIYLHLVLFKEKKDYYPETSLVLED